MIPIPAVIVEEGETLSHIALREWGDANLWWLFATANALRNPHLIYPGDILIKPVPRLL